MAQNTTTTATVITKINGEQAEKELEKLTGEAKQLRSALAAAYAAGDDKKIKAIGKQISINAKESRLLKQSLYDVNDVLKRLDTASLNELNKALRSSQNELNKMKRGTAEYDAQAKKVKLLSAEVGKLRGQQQAVTSGWQRAANNFNNYAGIVTAGLAAVTGAMLTFNRTMQLANEKEDAQANLSALTGLDDNSIAWLTSQAETLSTTMTAEGVRIRKSSKEIIDAFTLVGSAKPELLGNKEALLEVTQQAMILAEAAKIDLTQAVDGVTLSMNQYGASADEAARYTNVMAAGSKVGAANVASVTSSILRSGVAASSAGVPIEQLVGSIETLAEKGIKDEIAGTGLKKFFLTLQTGADDTNPAVVGLNDALDNLAKKQLTAAEIKKLFGEEGYNVASVLINSTEKVKEYTAAVTNTSIALEQATKNSQTNAARLAQLRNELNEIAIEIGQKLMPVVITLGSGFKNTVLFVNALIDVIKEYGAIILTTTAAIAAYTVAVNASTIADKAKIFWSQKALVALLKMRAALLSSTAGWGALVTVIGVVIGLLIKYVNENNAVNKSMKEFQSRSASANAEAELLFNSLRNLEKGSKEYQAAQQKIIDKYPDLLKGQVDENGNLKNIETAYRSVITALEEKIALEVQQEALTDIMTSKIEKQQKLLSLFPQSVRLQAKEMAEAGKSIEDIFKALENNDIQNGNIYIPSYHAIKKLVSVTQEANKEINAVKANFAGFISQESTELTDEQKRKLAEEKAEQAAQAARVAAKKKQQTILDESLKAIELRYAQYYNTLREQRSVNLISEQEYNEQLKNYTFNHLNEQLNIVRQKYGEDSIEYANAQAKKLDAVNDINALIDAANAKQAATEKAQKKKDKQEQEKAKKQELKAQEDYEKKLAKIQNRYGLTEKQSQYETDLTMLKQFHEQSLLSEEEYQQAKKAIEQKYKQEQITSAISQSQQVLSVASEAVDSAQNYELAAIDAKYAKEIAAAQGNEERITQLEERKEREKAAINAKYADLQMATDIGMAISSAALAIIKCFSDLGPIGGAIAAIPTAAATGLQIATMVQQRNAIKSQGYFTGGFTPAGAWDQEQGVVHSNEFVANRFAVANPSVRRVLNVIDSAQKNNTVSSLTARDVSFISNTPTSNAEAVSNIALSAGNNNSDNSVNKAIENLNNELAKGIKAYVLLEGRNGFNEAKAKDDALKNNIKWQ